MMTFSEKLLTVCAAALLVVIIFLFMIIKDLEAENFKYIANEEGRRKSMMANAKQYEGTKLCFDGIKYWMWKNSDSTIATFSPVYQQDTIPKLITCEY